MRRAADDASSAVPPIAAPASRLIFGVSEASLRGWRGTTVADSAAARASGRASAAAPVVLSIVRREVRLIRAYYTGGGPTCQAESGTDSVESARIPAPNRNDRSERPRRRVPAR